MNVILLHEALPADARADESDVLDQIAAIAAALDELGHRNQTVAIDGSHHGAIETALADLPRLAPDVVFNLVESVGGSGRDLDLVPRLLERLGLPYTGCGPRAMQLAASKLATKQLLVEHGLPTPLWWSSEQLRRDVVIAPARYVIKSVWEHGSLGLEPDSVVHADRASTLAAAIDSRLSQLGGEAFAEAYVHGREFNLALLDGPDGVEHLPPAEIRFASHSTTNLVGYRAKWSPGSTEDLDTPRSFADLGDDTSGDAPLLARLRQLAAATWRAFGLAGYARIDLRVDSNGEPSIIDVNTNPCLSPGAGFAAALDEAGITFPVAVQRMLAAALHPAT